MTRFTSKLAIATVAFGLVAGFGPGLMQPAFAGKGGHEAAQHETNGGKGGDRNSADKAGGTSSVDKGGDKNSADKAGTSSVDKGGNKNSGTETEAAETETGSAGSR